MEDFLVMPMSSLHFVKIDTVKAMPYFRATRNFVRNFYDFLWMKFVADVHRTTLSDQKFSENRRIECLTSLRRVISFLSVLPSLFV